ncbi:RCC1 domain-containing protein [Flavobacterium sp.]
MKLFYSKTMLLFIALNIALPMVSQNHCTINYTKVMSGHSHSLAIKNDGTLWAWGENTYGELGIGTTVQSTVPLQVGANTNWASISVGMRYSLAISTDGKLWAWGNNSNGQLGDGTTVNKNTPIQIGTNTNWTSVTAGESSSFAITNDGKLWAWGRNTGSFLGDGTSIQRLSPVQIGTGTNWASISAGSSHCLATTSDGKLWAWGYNNLYQLGDGTNTQRTSPFQIGTETNWSYVSAGIDGCSLGIKNDGTLWVWGNNRGRFGNGSIDGYVQVPTQVGTNTNWSMAKFLSFHTIGLTTDGKLWSWGENNWGQLGDNTRIDSLVPMQIGSDVNWNFVSGGENYSTALNSDGKIFTFGRNNGGQLGDGTSSFRNTPSGISYFRIQPPENLTVNPGQSATFSAIASGTGYTYRWQISTNGGLNFMDLTDDQVYSNTMTSTLTISRATSNMDDYQYRCVATASCAENIISVEAHLRVVCLTFNALMTGPVGTSSLAITNDGNIWGWGNNADGRIGDGTTSHRYSPVQVTSDANWRCVSTGSERSVGITNDGKLWHWGRMINEINDNVNYFSPVQLGTATNWILVTNSWRHNLAITNDGKLWGWGSSNFGELGNGQIFADLQNPTQIGTATNWVLVDTGTAHTLGITSDGKAWSWGYNLSGQLGIGSNIDRNIPTQIGTATNWTLLKCGNSHSLGITNDGKLWAWGNNSFGQLGDGTNTAKNSRVQIGTATNWLTVSAGTHHTLGVTSDGKLWAWGLNDNGQLGDGTTVNKNTPIQVGTATNWVSVCASANYSLALNSDGQIWAFGLNVLGMLGNGTTTNSLTPVLVNGSCQNLSIDQINENNTLLIYPNPNNGNFTIDFDSLLGEKKIEIYNILGQIIYNSKVDNEHAVINLSGKPKGIFICRISQGSKIIRTGKIIIE